MNTYFKTTFVLACLTTLLMASSCQLTKKMSEKPVKLKTYQDSLNYCHGVQFAQQVGEIPNFDARMMIAGIEEANKKNPQLSTSQIKDIITYEKKRVGIEFLAENGKKAGVTTTESGLQYRVITEGKGAKPAVTDKVKVHYEGHLIDGSEFDSSIKRGEPISFHLNRVIKGWTEGLQLMNEGGKYELVIPSDLAYGDRAMGDVIPAYSVLIFEIELIAIEK